ncbi:TM2 domain-containing protein [Metamycoplasma buccale]|uniref:TM2 domain-containing protein n=1 Tax=Metamycoplasma buccale TaxID=55602 RepID=UPI00398E427C
MENNGNEEIKMMATNNVSPKSRLVLTILSGLLGQLGVDRFYSGRWGLGLLKLFTFGGFGIWALIDFVLAVCGVQKDEKNLLISDWQTNNF